MNRDLSALVIYTIYRFPSDYPGLYVVRPWHCASGETIPGRIVCVSEDIEMLRQPFREAGLCLMTRSAADDPTIVENWL